MLELKEILTGTVAIVVLKTAATTDTVGESYSHTKLVLLLETLDRWFLDISSSVSISALKKRHNYTLFLCIKLLHAYVFLPQPLCVSYGIHV